MICGALQTLNEEAFEDVASNEMGPAPGETLSQQLAPIREGSEFSTSMDSGLSVAVPNFSGGGGGGLLGLARNTNTNLMSSTAEDGGDPCYASSSVIDIAELVGQPSGQQQHKDKEATVIVMSEFTRNINDTSL